MTLSYDDLSDEDKAKVDAQVAKIKAEKETPTAVPEAIDQSSVESLLTRLRLALSGDNLQTAKAWFEEHGVTL